MAWREYLNIGELTIGNAGIKVTTYDATMTVGAKVSTTINVEVQLNDPVTLDAILETGVVDFYLADDAAGATPSTTAPNGGLVGGASGAVIETVADLAGKLVAGSGGVVDVALTDSGTPTFYLVLVLPTGGLVVSDAITF